MTDGYDRDSVVVRRRSNDRLAWSDRRQLGRASLGRARRRRQSSTDLERRWRPCVNADDVQCSLSVCLSAGYCARLPGGPAVCGPGGGWRGGALGGAAKCACAACWCVVLSSRLSVCLMLALLMRRPRPAGRRSNHGCDVITTLLVDPYRIDSHCSCAYCFGRLCRVKLGSS